MTAESTVKAAVRKSWQAAWDEGNVDALDGIMGDSFTRSTQGSATSLDVNGLKDSILATRTGFPDLKTTIEHLVEEGDRLAIFWTSTGTHDAELFGVPPTHREVSTFGANFCRIENGRIVQEQVTWDPRHLLSALGITSLGEE